MMDNFQNFAQDQSSDESEENAWLFDFVFKGKDSTSSSSKPEKSEYKIKVATDLQEHQGKSRSITAQSMRNGAASLPEKS